ncbi:putative short-chain dehydrogenase/reductase SDR [Mycobacterium xenopi 3993]|nr:putative short-chain dehydrogenase/reductase SDR [Mycobacterium xenopi 3993]
MTEGLTNLSFGELDAIGHAIPMGAPAAWTKSQASLCFSHPTWQAISPERPCMLTVERMRPVAGTAIRRPGGFDSAQANPAGVLRERNGMARKEHISNRGISVGGPWRIVTSTSYFDLK